VIDIINSKFWQLHTRVWAKLRASGFLLLLSVILVKSLAMSYDNKQDLPRLRLENLQSIDLEDVQRLMIIAPHPDDESLGTAGLIQAVLEKGGNVQVVIVTNGDGQAAGPVFSDAKILLNPNSYITYGRERQKETLKALSVLGVSKDKVIFLGYPDGKLKNLWNNNWVNGKLISGRFTHATSSPYKKTYNTKSVYLGSDLFGDFMQLLKDFQPDLVLVPHPEDSNEDHRAISDFSRFAIANYQALTSNKINILGYLVHYGEYPMPRGTDINQSLLPPASLSNDEKEWVVYNLTAGERSKKLLAVKAYRTQQRFMGNYLDSFARANEIYYELPTIDLPWLALGADDDIKNGMQISSILIEPIREQFGKLVIAGADLVSWQTVRLGDKICFSAGTRGRLQKEISYKILVKLPNGSTLQEKVDKGLPIFPDRFFGACFSTEELGNPNVIGLAAETWSGMLLDRTAWYFVILNSQN
jgi:LmbE family N-acetylglucosaminyl deacetylase